MFKPKVNSLKKSGKVVGTPPEYPELGHRTTQAPARKSKNNVVRPGGKG